MTPATDEWMDEYEAIAQQVKERLVNEVLYELQTGGGIALGGDPGPHLERRLESIRRSLELLTREFPVAPKRVARWLGRPGVRVLDVGAGSARWSAPFAAFPGSRLTALDIPAEFPRLESSVTDAGLRDRYRLIEGDVFQIGAEALGRHDVVIAANLFHLFADARCRELFARLAQLVEPGGTVAMIDQLLDVEPDWGRWAALYAVGILHRAPGGRLYPLTSYERWMRETGFTDVEARTICAIPPLTLVSATRSA
jgi:SAM-dependent methyltransferase